MSQPQPCMPPAIPHIPVQLQETLEWLIKREEFPAAKALLGSLRRILPPHDPQASDYLASGLHRSKHYSEASAQALHTLSLVPDSIHAKFNLAKCLQSSGDPYAAERYMAEVVQAAPHWIDPQIDLAVYIGAQGRVQEAMERLLALASRIPLSDPNHQVVQFNLGWHRIRTGDFKEGMRLLGIGRQLRIWGAMGVTYPRPKWTGAEPLAGRRLLLVGEGGSGDEMINVRFAQTARDRGATVLWATSGPLRSLFSRVAGVAQVISPAEAAGGHYDLWAPAMDLPTLLGVDLKELPRTSYVSPAWSYVEKWRALIPPSGRLRVGLRWQGNALYEQDLMRSIPFSTLESLSGISGVELYSLQRDEGADELKAGSPVVDLSSRLSTWEDTAGAVANLDLVISSCTSVAHLAAAMGKPTWVVCPLSSYYVWASPGESSPWYPSVRLFRQERFNSWAEPLARVAREVEALAQAGQRPVATKAVRIR